MGNQRWPWVADLGDGQYRNPVLYADYSDPDVISVGDDFYMTASSFAHVPGLPILHSKDLVNWRVIQYALPTLDLPGYDTPQHGKGVWAPSLRYHNGLYWIFFGAPDEGIYMTTAVDPAGKWSPLHQVAKAKGWIDTCPFWDDDGQAYLVHAFANSRCGIKHKLRLCRMSPDGKQLLEDGPIIFDGTLHHPTLEGPKLYKRNGYYYIFAPAGGVATGWQTVLRSRHIYGPYEDKIVMHQGTSPVNGPHQGGWVELSSGESWFIHFQDRGPYGRIVHLQPMHWVDDWPVIGEDISGTQIGQPVMTAKKPNVGAVYPVQAPDASDCFNKEQLGLQWQWQANPGKEWLSLTERPGFLRLYAFPLPEQGATLTQVPHLLLQKFPAPTFAALADVQLVAQEQGEEAGLVVFGDAYATLTIRLGDQGLELVRYVGGNNQERVVWSQSYEKAKVFFKVEVDADAVCTWSFSEDGIVYEQAGPAFQAVEGRWVGAKVGLYALRRNMAVCQACGFADIDSFEIVT